MELRAPDAVGCLVPPSAWDQSTAWHLGEPAGLGFQEYQCPSDPEHTHCVLLASRALCLSIHVELG